MDPAHDFSIRTAAFQYLELLRSVHGEAFLWAHLVSFQFEGVKIPGCVGVPGIWKPGALDLPLSIRTGHEDPYGDEVGTDGFLTYHYQRSEARSYDNEHLRRAMDAGVPLVYFHGLERGLYTALWPAVIVGDDPASRTFRIACEDIDLLVPGLPASAMDEVRRRYVTRLAVQRLHQDAFRTRVLRAYRTTCAVCHLRNHRELLDAAHIIGDKAELGDPVVSNGLALCKIHHAAFDANILGVTPNYIIEISAAVLEETDGPMLRHGLQETHGRTLFVPSEQREQPDRKRLEARYDEFRHAS